MRAAANDFNYQIICSLLFFEITWPSKKSAKSKVTLLDKTVIIKALKLCIYKKYQYK